ncbi:uncharacterized protein K452DRAFT_112822 [Aplosporella prunicola CBS 121167]|uniref:Uncharacterized protein n=1 Tax=Aplosporella prunicola CBS 121167 TaxID=1176127 RepID=A0A6A6B202_9PEZI|nr:uncharacterized protein K452DRAFT_112822 [Aplosporella prunicola CBS 121167]KAF2137254.1 hypothetical protein K452DRAFT_112822 [Aplosporella prunicola CBS 121167]
MRATPTSATTATTTYSRAGLGTFSFLLSLINKRTVSSRFVQHDITCMRPLCFCARHTCSVASGTTTHSGRSGLLIWLSKQVFHFFLLLLLFRLFSFFFKRLHNEWIGKRESDEAFAELAFACLLACWPNPTSLLSSVARSGHSTCAHLAATHHTTSRCIHDLRAFGRRSCSPPLPPLSFHTLRPPSLTGASAPASRQRVSVLHAEMG